MKSRIKHHYSLEEEGNKKIKLIIHLQYVLWWTLGRSEKVSKRRWHLNWILKDVWVQPHIDYRWRYDWSKGMEEISACTWWTMNINLVWCIFIIFNIFYRFSYTGKGVFIGQIAYLNKFSLDVVSFMFEIHTCTHIYMFIDRYVHIYISNINDMSIYMYTCIRIYAHIYFSFYVII